MPGHDHIPAPLPRPTCPRCNYDLSGITQSWTDTCPLTGTCSECGLSFDWPALFNPTLIRVPGFYEHARHYFNLARAWRTWSWCILPWRFAARIKIEHPPRVGRLLLWLPVLLVPLFILQAASRLAVLQINAPKWRAQGFDPGEWHWPTNCVTAFLGRNRLVFNSASGSIWKWHWTLSETPAFIVSCLAAGLITPLVLLTLAQSRATSRIRASHILRCGIYGLAWLVVPGLIGVADEAWLVWVSWANRQSPAFSWIELYDVLVLKRDSWWLAGIGLWLALWWWFAITRILRLPRGTIIWLLCMLIAALAGTIASFIPLILRADETLLHQSWMP